MRSLFRNRPAWLGALLIVLVTGVTGVWAVTNLGTIAPDANETGTADIGETGNKWRDGYLSRRLITSNVTATGFTNSTNFTITGGHFRASADNTSDIGTTTVEFRDAYFDGELKVDTLTVDEDVNLSGLTSASNVTATGFVAASNFTVTAASGGAIRAGTDNAVDIGTSTVEFRNAYFDGTVTTDDLEVDGIATVNGLTASGFVAATNFTITGGAFRAGADNTADIGTSTVEFRNAYFDGTVTTDDLEVDGVATVNGLTASGFVAATNFTVTGGAFRAAANNTVDIGTSSVEFKDAYFDGTVTTDALTNSGNTSTASLTLTGASDLYKTVAFAITQTNFPYQWEHARWTTSRAIKIKRGYLTLPRAPSGGTIGLTLISGSTSMALTSTNTRTASSTTDINFASGSDIRVLSGATGASTGVLSGIVVFEYRDN